MLKLLIIFLIAILLLYHGTTFIYLIRSLVGKYEEAEINTVWDAYSFAINPLNWIKLYKAFFYIAEEKSPNKNFYKIIIISNIICYIFFIILVIILDGLE